MYRKSGITFFSHVSRSDAGWTRGTVTSTGRGAPWRGCECVCTAGCVQGKTEENRLHSWKNNKRGKPKRQKEVNQTSVHEQGTTQTEHKSTRLSPQVPPTLSPRSHCSAVLNAGLGGDVGPGQQRAQQRLGLPVQPLRDGAGAQAGQAGADVLDIVSGTGSQGKRERLYLEMNPLEIPLAESVFFRFLQKSVNYDSGDIFSFYFVIA